MSISSVLRVFALFFVLLAGLVSLQAEPLKKLPPIRLKAGDIHLLPNVDNYSPASTIWSPYDVPETSFRVLVLQFLEIPTRIEREKLEKSGIVLRQYLPYKAYQAWVPRKIDSKTLKRLGVVAVTALPAQYKMEADVYETNVPDHALSPRADVVWVTAQIGLDFPENIVSQYLADAGWQYAGLSEQREEWVQLEGNVNDLFALASLPFVDWVAWPEPEPVPYNLDGFRRHGNGAVARPGGLNLTGEGVTVGIGDGGYIAPHVDLQHRVNNLTQSNITSFGNHGDHVGGTVGGAGNRIWRHAGMAPRSTLLADRTSSIWSRTGINFTGLGMVLSNNSYGAAFSCNNRGTYSASSVTIDRYARDYPKVLHVFAAGNDGGETCAPYPRRYLTVNGSYTSAKNSLAVGALSSTGGLTGFSSRGPTRDGRVKPEICGVGAGVTSTIPTDRYGGKSGTSMAAPTVTGSLALLYQHYRNTTGEPNPDGTLIKAIALNTAEDLGNPGPDFFHGYGEMNTRKAARVITNGWYVTDTISQGQSRSPLTINVPADAAELRVMIAWADAPGSASAAVALVNDLNLTVQAPGGTTYDPWILDVTPANVGSSATRGVDSLNNIEQVTLRNPASGVYTPNIAGHAVPQGGQKYFLVYEIRLKEIELLYPVGEEGIPPGQGTQIWWDADGLTGGNLVQEFSSDGGATWTGLGTTGLNTRRRAWTPPNTPTHQARIRVRHSNGTAVAESDSFTILAEPSSLVDTPVCAGYHAIAWNAVPGADYYDVMVLDTFMKVVDTTSATYYLLSGLDPAKDYWVTVRGRRIGGNPGPRTEALKIRPNSQRPCPWPFDLGLVDVQQPNQNGRAYSASALTNSESIRILIRNVGSTTITSAPVGYRINGGVAISETFTGNLSPGGQTTYTFSALADLSAKGGYEIETWVALGQDSLNQNDTARITVRQLENDSLNLPFFEGFETALPGAYLDTAFGVPGMDRLDFSASDAIGRLRTNANVAFPHSGNRALTLDVAGGNVLSTNYGILTLNMGRYVNASGVLLDFWYIQHGEESHPQDRVYLRGSENDPWIEIYNWYQNRAPSGAYKHVTGLDLSTALANAGQQFSATTQIRFGQQDDYDATTLFGSDGLTVDDIQIYQGTPPPFSINCPANAPSLFPQSPDCGVDLPDYRTQVQVVGTGSPTLIQFPNPGTRVYDTTLISITGILGTDTAVCSFQADFQGFSVSVNTVNPGCGNGGTASVTGGPQGGIGTRGGAFLWSTGDTTQSVSGLAAGNYWVLVTNWNGCEDSVAFTLTPPPPVRITVDSARQVACHGDSTGRLVLSAAGFTGNVTYSCTGGTVAGNVIRDLPAGTYTITATDSAQCVGTLQVTISEPPALQLSVVSQQPVGCHGDSTGSILVAMSGGSGSLTLTCTGGAVAGSAVTNLPAGNYTLTLRDSLACAVTLPVTITEPAPLQLSVTARQDVACKGDSTGSLTLTATGGTGPYTFTANAGNVTGNVVSNLPAGPVSVSVWDAGQCPASQQVVVAEPPRGRDISLSVLPEACPGLQNGSAGVALSGAHGVSGYLWSNGDTTANINGLAPGQYTVQVFDAICADTTLMVRIDSAVPIQVQPILTHPSSSSASDGSANLQITGGSTPAQVLWSNGDTSRFRQNMAAGSYPFTVTDAAGCNYADTVVLTAPADSLIFEYGWARQVTDQWQTVTLNHSYDTMVVIATPVLPGDTASPVVTRVRVLDGNRFQVRIQTPGAPNRQAHEVAYLVVEAGVYTAADHGIAMEARLMTAEIAAGSSRWKRQTRAMRQAYTQPVVLGQVMSQQDSAWSVFWASARSFLGAEPRFGDWAAGIHVGQDSLTMRKEETIGVIVAEAGYGQLNGLPFEIGLGPDKVMGPEDDKFGFEYGFRQLRWPNTVVLSAAGMDGNDGYWPVLYGRQPMQDSSFILVADEDQIMDAERRHTREQVAYWAFGDTVRPSKNLNLVWGILDSLTDAWQVIQLPHSYQDMVVVASLVLPDSSATPAVTRVQRLSDSRFRIRIQQPGGGAVGPYRGYYLVAEEGVYNDPQTGVHLEAIRMNRSKLAYAQRWGNRMAKPYNQSYVNPVVVGQVMGYDDPEWSVFWASSARNNLDPVAYNDLSVGRHIGSDPATSRPNDGLGYMVFEAGGQWVDGYYLLAGLGGDSIRGVGNPLPNQGYALFGLDSAFAAVVSISGMDGADGGWPVLWLQEPQPGFLSLAIDEDQLDDLERDHTTEQVAYVVWGHPTAPGSRTASQPLASGNTEWIRLWPNPSQGRATLRVHASGKGRLILRNLLGQSIVEKAFEANQLPADIKLDLGSLSGGLYYLQVVMGERQQTIPLQIQKN